MSNRTIYNTLTRTLRPVAERCLPPSWADRARIAVGRGKRVISREEISRAHGRIHGVGERLTREKWVPRVTETFFRQTSANAINPDDGLNYAESWIPYLKGKTSIVLYNFFEKNYGIKDPVLYRIAIWDDAGRICSTEQRLLGPDDVTYISTPISERVSESDVPDHGTLLVQAFHPRISILNDQLRYFGLFGSVEKGPNCVIHANPLPPRGVGQPAHIGNRAMGPVENTFCFAPSQSFVRIEGSDKAPGVRPFKFFQVKETLYSNPYFMTFDDHQEPRTIWHEGPTSLLVREAEKKRSFGPCRTGFASPDFERFQPRVFLSATQIGFDPKRISLFAYDQNGKLLAEVSTDVPEMPALINVGELFASHHLKGPVCFVLDFHRDLGDFVQPPQCYVHVFFNSPTGPSDQAHSERSFGFWNMPSVVKRGLRCRKFTPLLKQPGLKFFYTVQNIGGAGENRDASVFIRLITDTGVERRMSYPLHRHCPTIFSGDEFLRILGGDVQKVAIVQLEHRSTNYAGSFFFINEINNSLGFDHFTGG